MSLTLVNTTYDGPTRIFTLWDGPTQYQVHQPMSGWTGRPQPYTVESAGHSYTTYNLPNDLSHALNLGA